MTLILCNTDFQVKKLKSSAIQVSNNFIWFIHVSIVGVFINSLNI